MFLSVITMNSRSKTLNEKLYFLGGLTEKSNFQGVGFMENQY